jgi:hypothetical protein
MWTVKAGVYEEVFRQESTVGVLGFHALWKARRLTQLDRNEFKTPEIIFDPTLVLSRGQCFEQVNLVQSLVSQAKRLGPLEVYHTR